MDIVREQMKHQPRKLRHYMDLNRQKQERLMLLKYAEIT